MAKKKLVIDEAEFPSNSNVNKIAPMREEPRVEEVLPPLKKEKRPRRTAPHKAVVRKKSFIQSIAQTLVGDSSENVGGYILHDVLIPAAKNTIQEMVQSGIEMLLFGERRSKSRDRGGSTKISYGNYYRDREERRDRPRPSYRNKFDLSEIFFKRGDEADEVLSNLQHSLEEYEAVTVADFFDEANIDGASWAHHKWGWTDLRGAYCTHTRNGWQIIFPDPIELD